MFIQNTREKNWLEIVVSLWLGIIIYAERERREIHKRSKELNYKHARF